MADVQTMGNRQGTEAGSLFAGPEIQTLRGTIERIMYSENGRLVAKIRTDPTSRAADGKRRPPTMTVLGSMAEPTIGQMYEFSGIMDFNDKFCSHEIRFDSYRTILPSDSAGIMSYLIDVAKWVGPSHARALVDAFGSETLDVLKNYAERVVALEIPGLTAERIEEMQMTLKANEKIEAATVELNNLLGGLLGPATVRKAIKRWGCDSASAVRSNPYVLTALPGVGFVSADAIAKKLGIDPQAMIRHKAAVCHVLSEAAAREGHTVLTVNRVEMDAARLVGPLRPDVFAECEQDGLTGTDESSIMLADMNEAERYIACKIQSMMSLGGFPDQNSDPCPTCDGEEEIDTYPDGDSASSYNGIGDPIIEPVPCPDCVVRRKLYPAISTEGLADDQTRAVEAFQTSPVFILTGAPGTGKTYTVARIVRSLTAAGCSVELAAPTGKAAKQMSLALSGVCPTHARTIHSLLEPTVDEESGEFSFSRNEKNPLECSVLIVDEFSMVDVSLCRSLLRAVPETTRILIVGDHYQLPSVGPGAVLRDLLAAGVPHYELKEIKRNAGLIVRACHAMKDGERPEPAEKLNLETGDNWRHVDAGDPGEIKSIIETLIRDKLPAAGIDRLWGWQLISPTNERGPLSCDVLNTLAKGIMNPSETPPKGLPFAVGDKVVRTKNGQCDGRIITAEELLRETKRVYRFASRIPIPIDGDCDGEIVSTTDDADLDEYQVVGHGRLAGAGRSQIRIVNGDIGIVQAIGEKEIVVRFRFPDREAVIKRGDHNLKQAYCLTCHKMQGSEIDVVILPLHRTLSAMPMVTREWIYTAFSRAKRFIVTVGDLSSINPMISRVGTYQRQTMLRTMIEKLKGFEL